jgi:hypothetical protein
LKKDKALETIGVGEEKYKYKVKEQEDSPELGSKKH